LFLLPGRFLQRIKGTSYQRVTSGITVAAAETLCRLNPQMTFIFVSGAGADSSERGRILWARMKGKTENALLRLPFAAAYMFRPGFIQPLDRIRSKTRAYHVIYALSKLFTPLLRRAAFPNHVSDTSELGRAMLAWQSRVTVNRFWKLETSKPPFRFDLGARSCIHFACVWAIHLLPRFE
jgi:uncharacterized protein YbjT (DUF2867 family)